MFARYRPLQTQAFEFTLRNSLLIFRTVNDKRFRIEKRINVIARFIIVRNRQSYYDEIFIFAVRKKSACLLSPLRVGCAGDLVIDRSMITLISPGVSFKMFSTSFEKRVAMQGEKIFLDDRKMLS